MLASVPVEFVGLTRYLGKIESAVLGEPAAKGALDYMRGPHTAETKQ